MAVDIKYNIDSATIKKNSPGIYKVDLSGWAFTSEGNIPEIVICLMYNNTNEYSLKYYDRDDVCAVYAIHKPFNCGFHVSFISTKNLKKIGVIIKDVNAEKQLEFIAKLKKDSVFEAPLNLIKRSYKIQKEIGIRQFAGLVFNRIITCRCQGLIPIEIKYNIDSATIKKNSPGIYKVDLSGWAFTSEGKIPEIVICLMYNNINEYSLKYYDRDDVCAVYDINNPLKCGFHVSFISTKNLKKIGVIIKDVNAEKQLEFIAKLKKDSVFEAPLNLIKRSYKIQKEIGIRQFAGLVFNKIITYRRQGLIQKPNCKLDEPYGLDINLAQTISNQEHTNNFVPCLKAPLIQSKPARLICFYLPQFHSIPENDAWWGEGFTEWSSVKSAQPQFKGHYQPHIPGDLGYYNLLDPKTQKQQVELAKLYGVEGFCFYFYWFAGKRLLEKPLENYLNDKSLDFPFCLCWANENWTRRWDGLEKEILISQQHSPEDDLAFIAYISKYFQDPRYIKVNGKPLLIVYRPSLLPQAKETVANWRSWCLKQGIGEIQIAYTQSFEAVNPKYYGFDAAIEFPPNISSPPVISGYVKPLNDNFACNVYDWRIFAQRSIAYQSPPYTLYRGICPSWDNTPRRKNNSTVFMLNSPELYKEWLINAIKDTTARFKKDDEKLIFINAWNEWAEGAYLEPDKRSGYAYLEMTRQALEEVSFDDKVLNITRSCHRDIYANRKEELYYYFKQEWNNRYDFILDYCGFFSLLVKESLGVFYIHEGVPYYATKENKIICLDSREKIFELYQNTLSGFHKDLIAFVLLQHNQIEHTLECVRSIKALRDSRIRIIIVDNCSTAENKEMINKSIKNDPIVKIIFNEKNKGFAAGNNIGYRFAKDTLKAKFVVMINNDSLVEDHDFISCFERLFHEWSFSALGPDIVISDGRNENPWNDYIYNIEEWGILLDLYHKQQEKYLKSGVAEFKRIGSISHQKKYIINPILQGAAIILSPLFILDNDYIFEEISFLYGEELTFAARALIKGELLLYSNQLKIIHNEGVTTGKLKEKQKMLAGYEGAIKAITRSINMLENKSDKYENNRLFKIKANDLARHENNKKKILFDLFFCQPGFHGGGEYGKAVFWELVNSVMLHEKIELWVAADPDIYLDQWIWDRCKKHRIKIIPVKNYDEIKRLINLDYFDLFFAPALVVYADGYEYMKRTGTNLNITNKKTKVIGVIHDIRDYELAANHERILKHRLNLGCIPEIKMDPIQQNKTIEQKHAEASALKDMYKGICTSKSIDTIVTVSNYTKQGIIDKIVNCDNKIKVFYSPMKHRPLPEGFSFNNINFSDINYALVVNAARLEKNASAVIKAFENLFSRDDQLPKDLFVVLTGINNLSDVGLDKSAIEHPERFILLPFLNPGQLEYMYQNASYLIYASLYEGFGYPPIEAMSYNKLCLVSEVTSIPEVCGDGAIYCNPYDLESIEQAIINLILSGVSTEKITQRYNDITSKQRSDLLKLTSFLVKKTQD